VRQSADRALDALPFRAAERAFALGRDLRRARRRVANAAEPHPRPIEANAAAAWTVRQLDRAIAIGAYSRAVEHAEHLLARLDLLEGARRGDALAAALRVLLATGERERARSLAATHASELDASVAGASTLELLELRPPRPRLPDGAPSPLGLTRMIEQGAIDAASLRRLLLARPLDLLRNPQLHLLIANAERRHDRSAAVASLDRYLRAHGLPHVALAGASGLLLRDLRFTIPAPRRGPLVSVLVAAHRAGATIEYAIDSLLAQTHRDLEVLVGDDASDDDTVDRVRARYRGDGRVRVFTSAANQGAYNLRNQLLARARGELIAIHDADDLALPVRIATQVERLVRTGAVASVALWLRVTADGRVVFFHDRGAARICLASLLAHRHAIEAAGGFRRARFGADLELHHRLRAVHGPAAIDVLRRPLMLGLWSTGSVTRAAGAEALEDGFRAPARRRYAELVASRADDDAIDRALHETGNWAEPSELREVPL